MSVATLVSTERVRVCADTDNLSGKIVWDAPKSLFYLSMMSMGIFSIPFATPSDWLIFLILTGCTILAGHSVGMHRLLIHRTFKTATWLEYSLVYLGVLVGMAGPMGMIRLHDMRDWHQRQHECPPFPSHGAGFWRDGWWQLHCRFVLEKPPVFRLESSVADSTWYRWLERTWMLQQLPLALLMLIVGGLPLVGLAIGFRVFVSLTGHWMVGHFAHKQGEQRWVVKGIPVQGYNLPFLSWITFGENWHGNHHAFPESALLGVEAHQGDPGFAFVKLLERAGLAQDIKVPESCGRREGLALQELCP